MGGLISLYALVRHGDVFGGAGVMSAALWYEQGRIFDVVSAATAAGRVYLDVGMYEGAGTLRNARRLARVLTRRGWRRKNGLLRYVEDPRGRHSEADWARRLPGALEFLLS
jgi:predicted alpha/beta superfamily hydrolase